MKLKKNLIYITKKNNLTKNKVLNINLLNLQLGDRIRITYIIPDTAKRSKSVSRVNSVIAFFIKYNFKQKTNTISFFVSILYHNEIVYWQFCLNSPHILYVELLFKYFN